MPAAKAKTKDAESISVLQINEGAGTFRILGRTPIVLNRMSQKGLHDLLFPPARKNAAERATSLKHSPRDEFRASPYLSTDPASPTRLLIPATSFKGAIRGVATDIPGSTKAQIGRLTYVEGDMIPLYGVPQLLMAVVRSADINRTPDVRTRAIVPEWAVQVTIRYIKPLLNEQTIANLLAAAGIMQGVGDWRQEKGNGNYGQFELVSDDNEDWERITSTQGLASQDEALASPIPYNAESAELLGWFDDEFKRRGFGGDARAA